MDYDSVLLQDGLEQPLWLPRNYQGVFVQTYRHDKERMSPRVAVYHGDSEISCHCFGLVAKRMPLPTKAKEGLYYLSPEIILTLSTVKIPGNYKCKVEETKGKLTKLFNVLESDAFTYIGEVPETDEEEVRLMGMFAQFCFEYGSRNGDFGELYGKMEKTHSGLVVPQAGGAERRGSGLIIP